VLTEPAQQIARPGTDSTQLLVALKAVAEDTRLRIVALLTHGELTVSDLVDVLGQSQPRISRHLRVLLDAAVIVRHREGSWAFFHLVPDGPIRWMIDDILGRIDPDDAITGADLDRRAVVRRRRADAAQAYFARIATRWDEERSLHAADDVVEAAIVEIAGRQPYRRIVDLGTGTGRMLQVLAADPAVVERAVGVDASHSMLAVARADLERAGIRHVELRQGDVLSPPLDRGSFDLVVVHQVLHFLDEPAHAVREAARLLSPGGRLLLVDFAPHSLEFLRTDHAHRRLGFRDDTVRGWLEHVGLAVDEARSIEPDPSPDGHERLTVSLWVASDDRSAARS
jgi:ArsR family transcriptional regulator